MMNGNCQLPKRIALVVENVNIVVVLAWILKTIAQLNVLIMI
jgi:hypothetical protein